MRDKRPATIPVAVDIHAMLPIVEAASLPAASAIRIAGDISMVAELLKIAPPEARFQISMPSVRSFLAFVGARAGPDWNSLGLAGTGHLLLAWLVEDRTLTADFGEDVIWTLVSDSGATQTGTLEPDAFAHRIDDILRAA